MYYNVQESIISYSKPNIAEEKMKKTLYALMIVAAAALAGCGEGSKTSVTVQTADQKIKVSREFVEPEEVTSPEELKKPAKVKKESKTAVAKTPKAQPIVWLGDSLTQGSLGGRDDNLPNAPYEKLKAMVNVPVEGYGMYAYNTHDIFWVYRDEEHFNQTIDPNKTYIFWVGSNDWCPEEGPNANTAPVIAEIDNFIAQNGGVKNYIVIGTTNRWRLGDFYIPINQSLAAHYGNHYLDVIDIIKQNGLASDNTHLSQASYDAIAVAVYQKLVSLGYI